MTEVTIEKLAEEIQVPIERLLQQLAAAGINKDRLATVTEQEKEQLLAYLSTLHGSSAGAPTRLTLQRKTHSTLSVAGSGGKNKFIQVEVRKNRTYVKRELVEQVPSGAVSAEKSSAATLSPTSAFDRVNEPSAEQKRPDQQRTKQAGERSSCLSVPPVKLPVSKTVVETKKTAQASGKDRLIASEKVALEEQAAALKRKAEEEARRKAEQHAEQLAADVRKLMEENEKRWEQDEQQLTGDEAFHLTTSSYAREAEDEEDCRDETGKRALARGGKAVKQKKANKLSLSESSKAAREEERANTRGKSKAKPSALQQSFNRPVQPVVRDVVIGQTMTVAELAAKMAVKSAQVIKVLMKLGIVANINQSLDQETAQLVAEEMGHKVTLRQENQLETDIMSERDVPDNARLVPRAPVVTIMGHVDHGKTSLLDYIRSTKIAAKEAGGITQHIGAYHVATEKGAITFLDTPGHAAFTAMRSRGAKVTDIVVLVVAADDGVMPQTVEAIQHARAASVPLVVAINKIDKPGADVEHIQQALSQQGVLSEAWGGDTQFVPVSAKTGMGIDDLLNAVLLQAEILELKAASAGMASGIVIESFLDRGRGPVATILVQQGVLSRGDVILCGFEYGRVRAMRNELGKEIGHAGPSIPVEVLGLSGAPTAGDPVTVVRDEKKARELALQRQSKHREIRLAKQQRAKLENLFSQAKEQATSEVNLIIKADVQGSVEAISDALLTLATEEVKVRIIGAGVGAVTETDATLAAASNAILIGFNVRADSTARRIIENESLDLRYYSVIYHVIDEVKQAMSGFLAPEYEQKAVGMAEVRHLFRSPKFGTIAGCMVTEGVIKRHGLIRVLRDNVVIYQGELESLRRFKEDVSEVRSGMECGIGVKNYHDVRSGDLIELYETIEIQRSID